jgi:hypothetical protein
VIQHPLLSLFYLTLQLLASHAVVTLVEPMHSAEEHGLATLAHSHVQLLLHTGCTATQAAVWVQQILLLPLQQHAHKLCLRVSALALYQGELLPCQHLLLPVHVTKVLPEKCCGLADICR